MSTWYLWDGAEQHGPMDAGELERRIRSNPDAGASRVWTKGLSEWTRPEDAFGPDFGKAALPPPLPPPLPAGKPRAQNFIARHWRGEYPLWVSYWVVGLTSNVAAMLAITVLSQFMVTQVAYTPLALWLFFVVIWTGLVELAVWQGVGIWRAASRRRLELRAVGKRAVWPAMAKVAICLGALQLAALLVKAGIPQIVEGTRMAFMGDPSIPGYTLRAINATEAEIAGGIKYGLTADLEKLLDAQPGMRLVHLDSVGGRIGEGKKLNALIRARKLDTYVEAKCMSACTLAFAGGRQRILRKGGVLGFHRGAFPGGTSEEVGSGVERQIYAAAGFSGAFIDRALATPNAEMWKPAAAELLSYKVTTRLSDGDEFAIGGFGGGTLTSAEWDQALLKATPAYRAFKQKYPADYAEMLDIFVKEAARGTPRAVVIGKARAKFNELIKNLLPQADDAVLIEFSRLAIDEYRALQAQDAAACYRYATGIDVDDSIIRMIPPDLARRENSVHEKIILSAQKRDKTSGTDAAWTRIRDNLVRKGYSTAELQALGGKTVAPSSYARYCAVTIDLYSEIIGLPASEASLVLREMYADG